MSKALFFDEDMDWDGPPWLTIYRWKCWIIGHRPEPVMLVDPKTGRETPQVWCWRCGKEFEVEMEPARSAATPVAISARSTAQVLEHARQPLALPSASLQPNAVRLGSKSDTSPRSP